MSYFYIPPASLSTSEEEAARKRRELRDKLLRGEEVRVSQNGTIHTQNERLPNNENAISVPPGKLASRFHWYENDPTLLSDEKNAMRRYFPHFQLSKLDDGRLYWYGNLKTDLRSGGQWYIQAIYENNHPNNSNYGGSVKVYSIEPDLEEIQNEIGETIPHLLRDSGGHLYLCTARPEDVRAGNVVTSAASSLAWAVKWISAFELWMAGDLKSSEFSDHRI